MAEIKLTLKEFSVHDAGKKVPEQFDFSSSRYLACVGQDVWSKASIGWSTGVSQDIHCR